MTEQPIVEVYGELITEHSESDAEAVGEVPAEGIALDGAIAPARVVVKRGRGRPRQENRQGRTSNEDDPK